MLKILVSYFCFVLWLNSLAFATTIDIHEHGGNHSPGSGKIFVDGELKTLPWRGEYNKKIDLKVKGVPDEHSTFLGWYTPAYAPGVIECGNCQETEFHLDFGMRVLIYVSFGRPNYRIKIDRVGNGKVRMNGIIYDLSYSKEMVSMAKVELTAIPAYDWFFSHWAGDINGNDSFIKFNMDGNKNITINFEKYRYKLEDKNVQLGDTVSFIIPLDGNKVHFQWQKNGVNIDKENSGILIIPKIRMADHGSTYRCRISDNDGYVTITNSATFFVEEMSDQKK